MTTRALVVWAQSGLTGLVGVSVAVLRVAARRRVDGETLGSPTGPRNTIRLVYNGVSLMRRHATPRRLAVVGATVGAMLAMTACAPGSQTDGSGAEPTAVSTDIASQGDITLNMLDFWQGADSKWADRMVTEFEAKYPNVTIKRTTQEWGQLMSTLNLRLSDADGPDIATANNGWQSLGTISKSGLVANLDKYATSYGWSNSIPATILRQNQFTTDGKTMGSGSLFGTPVARSSLVGLYYNVDLLTSLGIEVPTTLEELEAACAKIKAAGQVPISYGSQDQGTAPSILLAVQSIFGDKGKIGDFVYGDKDAKASDTSLDKASTTIKSWADQGWFTPNFEGVQYQDLVADFKDGKGGVFRFDYSGALSLTDAEQSHFGYLQLPQASGKTVGVGSSAAAVVISSKSKHPDAAAAFLDFMMSKEAAQAAVDLGFIPMMHSDVTVPTDRPDFAQEVAAAKTLDADDGYIPYFDWTSPTMLDTLGTQLQLLFAGQASPDALVAAVQADRDAFQATQG